MNEVRLQEKQLTGFVTNNKIWAFKQNYKFIKLASTNASLTASLEDFSDEISGDNNGGDGLFSFSPRRKLMEDPRA